MLFLLRAPFVKRQLIIAALVVTLIVPLYSTSTVMTFVKPHTLQNDDKSIVARLDTEYQSAVQKNDMAAMDRILADDFVLVTGKGRTFTKADLLKEARAKNVIYERQEDSHQTVRVWGNTAVVTALLWAKGNDQGKAFEYKLWFSDTYVRTPIGWRYVFGQASLPLPQTP